VGWLSFWFWGRASACSSFSALSFTLCCAGLGSVYLEKPNRIQALDYLDYVFILALLSFIVVVIVNVKSIVLIIHKC